jgi:hypothetical protein
MEVVIFEINIFGKFFLQDLSLSFQDRQCQFDSALLSNYNFMFLENVGLIRSIAENSLVLKYFLSDEIDNSPSI